jgi:hypothetical protein
MNATNSNNNTVQQVVVVVVLVVDFACQFGSSNLLVT